MTNARNLQRLEDDSRKVWPGMVIYDVGDEAHAAGTSGHNHDDKSGVKAEQTDSDTKQEVRALDWMIGPKFTKADADRLFNTLTRDPACQRRMYYVIWNRRIRSRRDGWIDRPYTGSNPHTDHVHGSSLAADDENDAPWTPVLALAGGATPTPTTEAFMAGLTDAQQEQLYKRVQDIWFSIGRETNRMDAPTQTHAFIWTANQWTEFFIWLRGAVTALAASVGDDATQAQVTELTNRLEARAASIAAQVDVVDEATMAHLSQEPATLAGQLRDLMTPEQWNAFVAEVHGQ